MQSAPLPVNEADRLRELASYKILDTPAEEGFDDLAELAAKILGTPIALVSLIDASRQWFKANHGLDGTEAPRDMTICGHTILQDEIFVISDTQSDPRFQDNPLLGTPPLRFYAGVPLINPAGYALGTLCVLDHTPRSAADPRLDLLRKLGRQAVSLLELRRARDTALMQSARFDLATQAAGVGVFEHNIATGDIWCSDQLWSMIGRNDTGSRTTLQRWVDYIHPDDRRHVLENSGTGNKARKSPTLQYRIVREDGAVRHVETTAAPIRLDGHIAGVILDITSRVEAEERERDLQRRLRESSHRAGMLEIASGILHNAGNVLNSLGIATSAAVVALKSLRLERLGQAAALLVEKRDNLAPFLTEDPKGRRLPEYLSVLHTHVAAGVGNVGTELARAEELLLHLRDIVSAQRILPNDGIIDSAAVVEQVQLKEVAESALLLRATQLEDIEVIRHYADVPPVFTDRYKLMQILATFISNACDAMQTQSNSSRRLTIELRQEADRVGISVTDTGCGMSTDVISTLWRFGATTKVKGRGFDLHNSANTAAQLRGTVHGTSDGRGMGSRFEIMLPCIQAATLETVHLPAPDREVSYG